MRKITLSIVLLSLVGMVYFSSCTKVEIENIAEEMTTTTIKGHVYANLDFRNDTNEFGGFEIQYEAVPSGTMLFAKLNSMDLDPNPNGTLEYETLSFETTVDASGDYQFDVYAGVDALNVTITAIQFEYNQVINDSTSEMKYFTLPATVVNVAQNSVQFADLIFAAN